MSVTTERRSSFITPVTTLLENPMPVILFGVFVEAVLGVLLLRTGRGILLGVMAGVLVLVLAGVALEWLVVTEVEEVEDTLYGAAAALEANDEDAVLSYCSESATRTRSEARRALDRVEFTQIRISNLDIKIIRQASPPVAKARFTALVAGRDRKGTYGRGKDLIRFTLTFRRERDGWRIIKHSLENAPGGF